MNKTIDYAILSDINKGPLANAQKEVNRLNLSEKVDLRLGSGIEILKIGEVEEVIIAGMGGILISELIESKIDICKNLKKMILQPMQAQEELRKYLYENNFEILDEHIVAEDFRIYEIMEVKYNPDIKKDPIDPIYFEIPEILLKKKSDLLFELIGRKIKECDSIIEKLSDLPSKNNKKINDRLRDIKNKREQLINLSK